MTTELSKLTWDQKIERLLARAAELISETTERSQRNEESIAQLVEQVKQNEEKAARSRRETANISDRLGRLVEDIIAPDLPDILRDLVDCPADEDIILNMRVQRKHPGQPAPGQPDKVEIDTMAACGNYLIINETKSTLRSEHVRRLLDLLPHTRDYFPEYRNHQVIGCVASLSVTDEVLRFANRHGLVVLAMKKGLIQMINPDGFTVRYY